jgi:hypothetical protein
MLVASLVFERAKGVLLAWTAKITKWGQDSGSSEDGIDEEKSSFRPR